MSYLITMGSRAGGVVLDPFSGSGTTCIAAKALGRHYIGIEREREFVQIARARLAAITNHQLNLKGAIA
jgi:modification methylase